MKRLATIGLLFCFFNSFGQSIVSRSNGSLTVVDSNIFAGNSFRVAVFTDTTQANTRRPSLDSAGKIIFTRNTNWFWGRQTSPTRRWVSLLTANPLNTSCGLVLGTGLVTWDSLLYFDVTPALYTLCCDKIPRTTNATVATLDSNDAVNPRIDAIVLDSNGVHVLKGVPSANPAVPQTNDCQFLLTYILINAGENIPANVTQNIIYDENYNTEWQLDTAANATIDTADVSFPAHLLHDMKFTSFLNNGSYFEFSTANTINLNDYGALKLYVRKTGLAPIKLLLTWFLDDVPQTLSIVVNPQGATAPPTYETIVIPLSSFRFISNSQVNKLRVEFTGVSSPTFIIDWIQLQGGIPNPQTIVNGITQVTAVGDTIINPIVNFPNSAPQIILSLKNQPANTIFLTHSNVPSQPAFDKMDLSRDYFTGLLPPIDIGGGLPGQFLGWTSGAGWQNFENDTTFVLNWLRRNPNGSNNNDSLVFGDRDPDSALLSFETYVGLNSFPFHIEQNGTDLLSLDPVINRTTMQATDGVAISQLEMDASLSNVVVAFSFGADDGSGHSAFINADALQGTLLFTTTKFTKFGTGVAYNYAPQSGTYAIIPGDYTIDCVSGTFTVTLPTAVGVTGQVYVIKNSGAGTITLATTGGQTIDGSATKTAAANVSYMVQSTGANWIVLSKN